MSSSPTPARRHLHFDLSYLGPSHETGSYTLRTGGKSYPMQRHTPATLESMGLQPGAGGSLPTHFAESVESDPQTVQLAQVFGPPAENGYPTLAAVTVTTSGDSGSYTVTDVASAIIFLNPAVTALTPDGANTVLSHIAATGALPGLQLAITAAGTTWNTPQPLVDMNGNPVYKSDGTQYCTYELDPGVLNSTGPVSGQSKTTIYSDPSLQGIRWNLLPGVSSIDMNNSSSSSAVRGARAATNSSGYSININDGGPNFGVSVTVNGLSDDFVLDLTVTNSYIRHTSVFVSFLKADGVTPMTVPDNIWTKIAKGAMALIIEEWLEIANTTAGEDLLQLLTSSDNTLKWCGNVSAENTFMGIPVSSSSGDFTFGMPSDQGPVGKIRLLVGSLGVASGNDWDPTAAWLGIGMTSLIDLAIPTVALAATVGIESNKVFDSIFKSPTFLLPTAFSVFQVAKDLFTGSPNTGGDIKAALTALADRLVSTVLTTTEVAAKLAAYFGAEEVEEAIPIVGWAMKVLAIEATVEQLAQTIGEVIGSPRVVEFDLTVTMNAQITLVPDSSTGGEFPATATTISITAQYSGNTTRTYTAPINDPKVPSVVIDWNDIPVGGSVTFIVAMYSKEGWGVGKGQSATIANQINSQDGEGNGILAVSVSVQQELYPLDAETTYNHSQLLTYGDNGGSTGYYWQETSQAPTETAESLGTGPSGHVLQALNGITLSDDLGILGYSWEASGLNIPPVDDNDQETELYTMQNVGFKPIQGDTSAFWPQAGYMTAPAGYTQGPLLLYLRTASEGSEDLAGPGTFFLDPTGNSTDGFHLRQVTPITDPNVAMNDPSRLFNLATGTSWGRFAELPTSLAIHSNGYVVGVNPGYNNMQILQLPAQGVADADAPWAYIPLGPGTGVGRLSGPALAAIRPDQTILVLEQGNQRIQAFSRGGHPVPVFPGATPYWIPLASHAPAGTSVVYLSMSVDVAGYVYVLSQNGNGYDASDFNLDIYTPTGQHLVYQQGLVAAGLAVDLWRNVYTLNFQQISGPGGRTEPSISEYIPSTPTA